MRFNINDYVQVKLTDIGRAAHRQRYDKLFSGYPKEKRDEWYRAPVEDSHGWSRWQMWALMEEVGWACGLSQHIPFETEIKIEVRTPNITEEP